MAVSHNKRIAHRWRLGLAIGAGLVFALGSFYMLQLMNVADMDLQAQANRSEPDYIIEKFSFVRMNQQGKPAYIISGDKLSHRPSDDTALIQAPYVQNLAPNAPPMTMRASRAFLDNATGFVDLLGGVHIERVAGPESPALSLNTSTLRIKTDEEEMETDQPVQMNFGGGSLTGVGLHANNATGQMEVLHDMHLVYPPKGAKK
ncbi:MAG: LPS export ABC transporter periplasmic protein LptC [Telluria sp.]